MKTPINRTKQTKTSGAHPRETEHLRQKIRGELLAIEINLEGIKGAEIERRSKALTSLFKLTQALDEHEEKQAILRVKQTQKIHTIYAKIPPPTDDEMRTIQDRLNSLYARLRTTQDADTDTKPAKPDGGHRP